MPRAPGYRGVTSPMKWSRMRRASGSGVEVPKIIAPSAMGVRSVWVVPNCDAVMVMTTTVGVGVHSKSSAYRERMDGLTIDEAAQRMGISKDTLRYYEKE